MDASGWDARYGEAELLWGMEPNVFVREHLVGLAPGQAVDLACGEGRNALWLASRGWQVTAVDFSPVALARARARAEAAGVTLDLVEADALSWTPAAPVDLVVVAYLQLPPEPRHRVLSRVTGWLRPGGTVVVVAHDRRNVRDGHGGPPSEEVCYDLDPAVAALGDVEVDVAEVAGRAVPTDEGERLALDTLIVARRRG